MVTRRRRLRNLVLFGLVATLVAIVAVIALRRPLQHVTGINADVGPGGRAELTVPDGYVSAVFAERLASPRFMAVSPDGTLVVAERGADRILAFPDGDRDGGADRIVEVGEGFEGAHSVAFEADGSLVVAGETTLFRVELGPDLRERSRSVVLDGLTTGGHSTRTVAVLPDGALLLSAGSTCNACIEPDPRRGADQPRADRRRDESRVHGRAAQRGRAVGRPGDGAGLGHEHGPRHARGRRPAGNAVRGRRWCGRRLAAVPRGLDPGPPIRRTRRL